MSQTVDVPEELAAIPWEWMHVSGRPLCMQAPTCRTVPWFDDASRGPPFFHEPLRVLLVGDARAERKIRHPLPGTREEVQTIGRNFRTASKRHDVTVLVGREATFERVMREMADGYDIVHLAGVAYVDESGESVVPLHDGEVRASELAALLIRNPPGLFFVNGIVPGSCRRSGASIKCLSCLGTPSAICTTRCSSFAQGSNRSWRARASECSSAVWRRLARP